MYLTLKLSSDRFKSLRLTLPLNVARQFEIRLFPTKKLFVLIILKDVWREVKIWLKYKSNQSAWGRC